MTDTELTVFLVDDDADIRTSLSRALSMRGYKVEAHGSAADFLMAWGRRPGCLVLDYGMPGMNGLELQSHLNRSGLSIPIIFITGHGGVPESVQAIKSGAIDFLEKPFRQATLVERIETTFAMVREAHAKAQASAAQEARFNRLTTREREIVDWMVENPSAISSKEVAAKLGISPRTVDHHRARILEKLSLRSVAELIALARSQG